MDNVTIISHLTPLEWKLSWDDKVVEDTPENMKDYQSHTCYWGHFSSDRDFTICHHREFEVKGMSMGLYFNGHLEVDEKGCRITGKFGKKKSANLFLIVGAIICLMAMLGGLLISDTQTILVAGFLLVILVVFYFVRPNSGQKRILEELKKISFDDSFTGQDRYHRSEGKSRTTKEEAKKRQRKKKEEEARDTRSMREKSLVHIEEVDGRVVEAKGGEVVEEQEVEKYRGVGNENVGSEEGDSELQTAPEEKDE